MKAEEDLLIVVSKNPMDIAMMSTGRGWKSCTNLRSTKKDQHRETPFLKIADGGMVVYLVRKDDPMIQAPLGRISLRRFETNEGKPLFMVDGQYGLEDETFHVNVKAIASEMNRETLSGDDFVIGKQVERGWSDRYTDIDEISFGREEKRNYTGDVY